MKVVLTRNWCAPVLVLVLATLLSMCLNATERGRVKWNEAIDVEYMNATNVQGLRQDDEWLFRLGDRMTQVSAAIGTPDELRDGARGPVKYWTVGATVLKVAFRKGRVDEILWWIDAPFASPVIGYAPGRIEIREHFQITSARR